MGLIEIDCGSHIVGDHRIVLPHLGHTIDLHGKQDRHTLAAKFTS